MRDAAEGNSGQGDSLLSLEACDERLASSDDSDSDADADGATAAKRIKLNDEDNQTEREQHA